MENEGSIDEGWAQRNHFISPVRHFFLKQGKPSGNFGRNFGGWGFVKCFKFFLIRLLNHSKPVIFLEIHVSSVAKLSTALV